MEDSTDKDLQHTALRETQEEIGLANEQVEIIIPTMPRLTIEGEIILPYIGIVDENFIPIVNPAEVDATFLLPLERFLSNERVRTVTYTDHGHEFLLPSYKDEVEGQSYKTRGMTALMCLDLAVILFQKEPEFKWDVTGRNTVNDPYKLQASFIQTRLGLDEKSKM